MIIIIIIIIINYLLRGNAVAVKNTFISESKFVYHIYAIFI